MSFYWQKMDKPEVNYDIHNNEMLAIVSAFKQWRHNRRGAAHKVVMYCDQTNREYFTTTKVLNRQGRQARWS